MKLSDFLPALASHKAETASALANYKAELATATDTISKLSAEIEALKASAADETPSDAPADDAAPSDEDTKLDKLVSDIQALLDAYKADESEDGDSGTDATPDDSDESADESAKATRSDKLKGIAQSVSKIVADNKKLKAEVPKQVIRTIATVGIPAPIATKPEGTKPQLTGRARVAAAFNEQLTK